MLSSPAFGAGGSLALQEKGEPVGHLQGAFCTLVLAKQQLCGEVHRPKPRSPPPQAAEALSPRINPLAIAPVVAKRSVLALSAPAPGVERNLQTCKQP